MKRIINLLAIFLLGTSLTPIGYAACPIEDLGACKADIGIGIDNNLPDRMVPDNLKKMTRPNSTMEMRKNIDPQVPSTLKTEPVQEENSPGYDANCQFGNCINKTPDSEVNR